MVEVDKILKKKFPRFLAASQDTVFRRLDRQISPEEALFTVAKQIKPGTCPHCQKDYSSTGNA
jgi:hypothetical protein